MQHAFDDGAARGERLGAILLADAVQRAYASASTMGSSMLVVEAINERAATPPIEIPLV